MFISQKRRKLRCTKSSQTKKSITSSCKRQDLSPGKHDCKDRICDLKIVLFPHYASIILTLGLPQWFSSKESTSNARAVGLVGLIPGSRRSPGGGHGNPLPYFCLDNPTDRGVWLATVHKVAKSQTPLKRLSSSDPNFTTNN